MHKKVMIFAIFIISIQINFSYKNITSCQTIDAAFMGTDREARVNQNLNYGALGSCINVNIENLTIDCQGFNLTGSGTGTGFNGENNMTVKNCNIYNFYKGTSLQLISNIKIINTSFINNADTGIFWNDVDNSEIINCTIKGNNNQGIDWRQDSDNNTFTGNIITENDIGIYIYMSSKNNLFINSYIYNNTQFNIDLRSNNNTFQNNYLGNSSLITSSDWNLYYNNTFTDNTYSTYNGCFDSPNNLICELIASTPSQSQSRSLFSFFENYSLVAILSIITIYFIIS